MEARDRPNSPAQIFAWRKEVRARLIANRLSIDPADRRQYGGKIALHLSGIIEPLSKPTVSFYWPFPMSSLGHKQTLRHVRSMSGIPAKADIRQRERHVRFVPEADIGPQPTVRAHFG